MGTHTLKCKFAYSSQTQSLFRSASTALLSYTVTLFFHQVRPIVVLKWVLPTSLEQLAERSFKVHRCSRNIAVNSRMSAELINNIIIGPYILSYKIVGFNQLRGLASAGASIPQCHLTHLPQNRNSHVFAEFTHSPYFHKNDVFRVFLFPLLLP